MPKYGFGIIADASTAGQQTPMIAVLTSLAALIVGRDMVDGEFRRWVLVGVTVPSTDKNGNPIQVEVDVGVALAFRSVVPRIRITNLSTDALAKLPMATIVETGDATNDALVERHLRVELASRGCTRWWGPLDRNSTIPAAPVPLSNFVELVL